MPTIAMTRDELARRFEIVYVRAALAIAERDHLTDAIAPLRARLEAAEARVVVAPQGPMAQLAERLKLDATVVDFLWAALAVASDPRLAVHLEALAGPAIRRGLSPSLYVRIAALDDTAARDLAIWLARPNPLVDNGMLVAEDGTSLTTRGYLAPARVVAHFTGDDAPDPLVRVVACPDPTTLVFDDAQRAIVGELAQVLTARRGIILVVEGPRGAGRLTAIAHAAAMPLVVLDAAGLDLGQLRAGLVALRREALLGSPLPVIAEFDRLGDEARRALSQFVERIPSTLVLTSAAAGADLGIDRSMLRVRWHVPATDVRRELWRRLAGTPLRGDLDAIALRYRVGPGAITRAIESARITHPGQLDAEALAAGLRHNITEQLGSLAERVEVTQSWADLVLADDTRDQVEALVARVRHAHHVLEHWQYRGKMARGTGVPALFSGPPGTGKTMVAGLIARELGLELYQVDLSQIVSKWVGETEKQLARVFDAAEQGHGLLLFDEADALFGQRSAEVKGATDRYANLEVNYLLQRIESFGGVTILTTNLDQSIDRALKRRLAAHIVFDLPEEDERVELWRRLTRTSAAPLARDLDPARLARDFPKMSGANIRNAALAAAFFAAADRAQLITQEHLVRAARVEYRSMGHVLADRRRLR